MERDGVSAVLVTGGHLEGSPDDLLVREQSVVWLPGERVEGDPVHGTGCALSSAIAALLARGSDLEGAVDGARRVVWDALRRARRVSRGAGLLGLP